MASAKGLLLPVTAAVFLPSTTAALGAGRPRGPYLFRQLHRRLLALLAFLSLGVVVAVTVFPFPFPPWGRHSPSDICPFKPPAYTHPYVAVRPRLYELLADVITNQSTALLLPTAVRPLRDESDVELYGWRQTPNVFYLLGPYQVAGGAVVLTRAADDPITGAPHFRIDVYQPVLTEREAVFSGELPSPDEVRRRHLVDGVFPVTDLTANLAAANITAALTTVPVATLQRSIGPAVDLARLFTVQQSSAALDAFGLARFVKTKDEITLLEYASRVAGWAHKVIQMLIETAPTLSENDIKAEFARLCSLCGGDIQAYGGIVGAGKHAAVLHYRTGEDVTTAPAPIAAGDLVLIDAAPEYYGYASDLTRTHVRLGVWDARSKEVYGIVARVQRRFIDEHLVEGVDWNEATALFARDFTEELLDAGFLVNGTVSDLLALKMYAFFMPHGLGHPVGVEVHDSTPKAPAAAALAAGSHPALLAHLPPAPSWWLPETLGGSATPSPAATGGSGNGGITARYVVGRGLAVTVEPGLYFISGLLATARANATIAAHIDWDKVDGGRYLELGGVRIEDVVLVDLDGKKRIITQ
ncbi:hypothetical protein HK405_004933 [Cladochytrium tenue]|nr:hypothetical protein HK405_004933 [Cladochytrium tenue]